MKKMRKTVVHFLMVACLLCIAWPAFAGTILIPASVISIEEEGFKGIKANTLVIPETTEIIHSKAFADSEISEVYLPSRTIQIAEDAFDRGKGIRFHAYMGSDNANWVLDRATDRNFSIEYINGDGTEQSAGGWSRVNSLIATEPTDPESYSPYYTRRLIVRLKSGNTLPDLASFNYKEIVPLNNNRYVIQFYDSDQAEKCEIALKAWDGCENVEKDYFLSTNDPDSGSSRSAALNTTDPMGFEAYTTYLRNKYTNLGHIRIAVIDNGINANQVGNGNIVSKCFDFATGGNKMSGYPSHGTNVANRIVDAFGPLASHLTILGYNIKVNGEISYLYMVEAIDQARMDGADIINISIAGASTLSDEQNNYELKAAIDDFEGRIIAAAGNHEDIASRYIPGKYCTTAGAVVYNYAGVLRKADQTCTGANYSGFESNTSFAAAKVTAAFALLSLAPEHSAMPVYGGPGHQDEVILEGGAPMPKLDELVSVKVEQIIINGGETPSSYTLEVGDPLSIQYTAYPSDATDPVILAESSDETVLKKRSGSSSMYYRFDAVSKGTATITFTSRDGNASPVVIPVTVRQPVTKIEVTGNTGELLKKGQTIPLTAKVYPLAPNTPSDPSVEWTSSNNAIATVSETGVVTQVGDGTVIITATSRSDPHIHGDSDPIEVTSEPAVNTVTVSAAGGINTLYVGRTAGTVQMFASVLPEGADQTVTWSVDREDVATISEDGLLTAVGDGIVTVIATSVSSNKSGYVRLEVIQKPTSVFISGGNTVEIGKTMKLTASVLPVNARDRSVRWSSEDTSILTVEQDGTVTGVGEGATRIYAECNADRTVVASKLISTDIFPTDIFINSPATDYIDNTLGLSATIIPVNATNRVIQWSTSDATIATVDDTGLVTAKAPGPVTIYASTHNHKTDSIKLTVRQPYTLIFNANDGSGGSVTTTCYSGYPIGEVFPEVIRTGYRLVGWSTAATGGSDVTASTAFTSSSSVTIYARWAPNSYNILYDANGGAVSESGKTVIYDSTYGTLATPFRAGYDCTGWFTAAEGGTRITESSKVTITATQTLYAHWTFANYTVTYNACGGTVSPTTKTVTFNSKYGDLATPSRTGYRFVGWYTAASEGSQITSDTQVTTTGNHTIYAHWMENTYTYDIVYKSSNGTSLGTSYITKMYGTTNTVTPESFAGYITPAAQNVAWDATYKTITFVYQPESVTTATTSGTFTTSPQITYTTSTQYRNRTAISVEINVTWTLTIHGKGSTTMQNAIHFWGTCGNVSIPNTKIISYNEWKGPYGAGTKKTKSATSSWVTVPLTTTNQTTLSLTMELWQCNMNGTKLTSNTHKTGLPLTVNIPAY